jgi:hypothetical protein
MSPNRNSRRVLLGSELRRRRVQLGHKSLLEFVRETPGVPAYQVLRAIEGGKRDNFEPVTIDRVEYVYRLKFGTIERFLDNQTDVLELADDPESGDYAETIRELQRHGISPEALREAAPHLGAITAALRREQPAGGRRAM